MGRELGAPEGLSTFSVEEVRLGLQENSRVTIGTVLVQGLGGVNGAPGGALSPVSAGPCPLHVSVDLRPEEGQNTPRGHTVSQEVSQDKKELPVPWCSHL